MSSYLSYVSKTDCEEIISTARIVENQHGNGGRTRDVFFLVSFCAVLFELFCACFNKHC